jgi:renal tumor antigen
MFEVVALYPLFPGTNELDQIQKIHGIIGTPPPELVARLRRRRGGSMGAAGAASATGLDFPACEGSGLAQLLGHVHPDCADLIARLLAYNPDDRLSARQALRHPYFRSLRNAERHACSGVSVLPELAVASGYVAL